MAFQKKTGIQSDKQKALQELSQVEDLMSKTWGAELGTLDPDLDNLDPDDDDPNFDIKEFIRPPREDVAPPPVPEYDKKYNPYQYHDIVTFCEHPYFLGLNLMPWQKIIVKSLYMGTYGNFHLNIDNDKTEDCSGCVWNYCRLEEERFYKARQRGYTKIAQPGMLLENLPCLTCSRFNPEYRKHRYETVIEETPNDEDQQEIMELMDRKISDMFQTELDLINTDLKPRVRDQVLNKVVERRRRYQELLLILGRRSGKSFMVGIITLYGTYKLIRQGHPQKQCPAPLPDQQVIGILNVAKSASQAKKAIFAPMVQFITASPFFRPYLNPEKILQNEMYIYTPYDLEQNEKRKKDGFGKLCDGTIHIYSGHSKAGSLVGDTMYIISIDEMAAMVNNSGKEGIDNELYDMLKPSLATFGKEGLISIISNPLRNTGKLYDLYLSSFRDDSTLMFQLPTWCSNPNIQKSLITRERRLNAKSFNMHYGAEFASEGDRPFLPPDYVHLAFQRRKDDRRTEVGQPLVRYFAHLDPAISSDCYALAIVHCEPIDGTLDENNKQVQQVIVDYMHVWEPESKQHPLNIDIVDKHIIQLHRTFHFTSLTFDQMLSPQSCAKLKNAQLPVQLRTCNAQYQRKIYQNLYDLLTDERIQLYGVNTTYFDKDKKINISLRESELALEQLLGLQIKYMGKGFKIEALSGQHDDLPDCIAGAAYEALNSTSFTVLPRTTSFYMGGVQGFRNSMGFRR